MVKKRNKRTRKKYKKRGGASNAALQACNIRLKSQGVKGLVNRRTMCNNSNAEAGLSIQEPAPGQSDQTIAQPKQSTELKQSSGVQSVIAPLEEEPKKQKSQKIKDRASALAPQLANRTQGRKALRTTVGSCRVAVDKGIKYYYNEAGEQTESPPGTSEFDKVCNPTEGIKKTGRTVGDCIEATYKNGKPYLYKNDPDGFSTRNMNDPRCFSKKETKVEGNYETGIDIKMPFTPGFKVEKSAIQKPKKVKEAKDELPACDTFNGRTCDLNRCVLEPKNAARVRTNKNPKKIKRKDRLCLDKDKKKGGKRTKRKKSRKKRKKSRKRRR
tara:strand:+ start:8790 stop:9770 length:981 start_codon:yes stop_codon:yes gene_type:complete